MEGGGGMMTLPMQPMGQRFFGSNPRMMAPAGQPKHPAGRVQRGDATLGQGQMRSEAGGNQSVMFDGKRMRKAVHRKTVDYNSTVVQYLENRVWQRDFRDRRSIQPDSLYQINLVPPVAMLDNPMNCVTTKFIRTSTNKFRCPIFCLAWTPEGRRLVTGASSGEFTLWNGLTFNFETILQAHDTSVRAMQWSHNDNWMVTGDHSGFIKYWQTNMNNVKMYQGHKEPVRGIRWASVNQQFMAVSLLTCQANTMKVMFFGQQLSVIYRLILILTYINLVGLHVFLYYFALRFILSVTTEVHEDIIRAKKKNC